MISSVCPKCGTLGKFGKRSCCGRGGSWFKNCGSRGNTKLAHTWYEGIQVCKASLEQSKLALGQPKPNPAQKNRNHPSNDIGVVKYEPVTTANTFEFPSINTSRRIPRGMLIITTTYTRANAPINLPTRLSIDVPLPSDITRSSSSMSIAPQGYEMLLKTVVHTVLLVYFSL